MLGAGKGGEKMKLAFKFGLVVLAVCALVALTGFKGQKAAYAQSQPDDVTILFAQCWHNRYLVKTYLTVAARSSAAPLAKLEVENFGKLTYGRNHKDWYSGRWWVDTCPLSVTVTSSDGGSAFRLVDNYAF